MKILGDYESLRETGGVVKGVSLVDLPEVPSQGRAPGWLQTRLPGATTEGLSEVDQFVFLRAAFPEVPADLLQRACARPRHGSLRDWSKFPWNRRLRRSVERARPGSVLLNFSPKQPGWKGMGRVIQVPDSDKGLGSGLVVQQLLR